MNADDSQESIEPPEAMHSMAEAAFLTRYASWLGAGCIVEIGSWRGASAIALALGAREQPPERRPMVYCIEPHASFVGVYGGRFGSADRTAFYRNMLVSGMSESVALINLPSLAAAKAWSNPIGLLFIDGDHSREAVAADVAAWKKHILHGGFILFDDALDPAIGPSFAIADLLSSGEFKQVAAEGKIVALQKNAEARSERAVARDRVRDFIKARAVEVGYDPIRTLTRFGYGSFVSEKHRYVYIETPKAACTTLKQLVAALEGAIPDMAGPPSHRETRLDMRIHERKRIPIPTMLDFELEQLQEVLSGKTDWFLFAISRNPFSRLVSVFEGKVRMGEPGYRALEGRYGHRGAEGEIGAAFRAFVREVVTDSTAVESDPHLCPQERLLMPNLISYSNIFKVERLADFLNAFRAHLRSVGGSELPEPGRYNSSWHPNWRYYYDEETAKIVTETYNRDFEIFGYDCADWYLPPDSPPLEPEPDFVRYWRAEVVERNALIDDLYDRLFDVGDVVQRS